MKLVRPQGVAPPSRERQLIVCFGIVFAFASVAYGNSADHGSERLKSTFRPNVLLIVIDTLRWDATTLGGAANDTPFLASLAQSGVVFDRAYSTHDFTPPSHFSILTGLKDGEGTAVDVPAIGLAFQLRKLGYETFGASGNSLLSRTQMASLAGMQQFLSPDDVWKGLPFDQKALVLAETDWRLAAFGYPRNTHNRSILASSSRRVLPAFAQQIRHAKQPFLAVVNLMDPHEPYAPNPDTYPPASEKLPAGFEGDLLSRKVSGELAHPKKIADPARRRYVEDRIAIGGRLSVATDLSAQARAVYRSRYQAKVRQLDEQLRDFFAFLEESGLLKSSIIVITSDHGESFGEADLMTHDFHDKGDYESTHHVPLVILLPPIYRLKARRLPNRVTIADIAPTIYDLLAVDWSPLKQRYGTNCGESRSMLFSKAPKYRARIQFPTIDVKFDYDAARAERLKQLKSLSYLH